MDTVVGAEGNDTVAGGTGRDVLLGNAGDDVMISVDDNSRQKQGKHFLDSIDKVDAGDDLDVCLFGLGEELSDCEY